MATPNPFAPPIERVPLKLMLDARSLGVLKGEKRSKGEFLCELCHTHAVDALWSWGGSPLAGTIDIAELRSIEGDHRTVGRIGESPHTYLGALPKWSQYARYADSVGLEDAARAWFMHYAPLTEFSNRNGYHFLVSDDQQLLQSIEGERGWFRQGQQRVVSLDRALVLTGLAMKAHREVIYESPEPDHTIYTSANSMYDYLARFLISSRRRLFEALAQEGEEKVDFYRTERNALCVAVFDRAADLLRGCDRISLANLRIGEPGSIDEVLSIFEQRLGRLRDFSTP